MELYSAQVLRVLNALHCLAELVASTVVDLVAELVAELVVELVPVLEVERVRVPQLVLQPQGQVLAQQLPEAELVLATPLVTVKVRDESIAPSLSCVGA